MACPVGFTIPERWAALPRSPSSPEGGSCLQVDGFLTGGRDRFSEDSFGALDQISGKKSQGGDCRRRLKERVTEWTPMSIVYAGLVLAEILVLLPR